MSATRIAGLIVSIIGGGLMAGAAFYSLVQPDRGPIWFSGHEMRMLSLQVGAWLFVLGLAFLVAQWQIEVAATLATVLGIGVAFLSRSETYLKQGAVAITAVGLCWVVRWAQWIGTPTRRDGRRRNGGLR